MDECMECGKSLVNEDVILPWEEGGNPNAFIRCPRCGFENIVYGYGEDD